MSRSLPTPDTCANCGESVPRNARACPHCGADERTGWRETSIYDGIDLPDDEPEAPRRGGHTSDGLRWYWVAAMIALLLVLGLGTLGLLR